MWTGAGPHAGDIRALAIDPRNPQRLFAGGGSAGGIYRSLDGGSSWSSVRASIGVEALAVDPANPQMVYAGGGSMWRSLDGGESWVAINAGLGGGTVQAVLIDRTNPRTLYIGLMGQGVYRTLDGGESWAAAGSGFEGQTVFAITQDSGSPQTIYAGTVNGGVYRTVNGGASWVPVGGASLAGKYVHALAADPRSARVVYAGTSEGAIYRTVDGGDSWRQLLAPGSFGLYNLYALAIDPTNTLNLYVASGGRGVFRSTDGGASWSDANAGLETSNRNVFCLAVDPTNPSALYAGLLGAGIYRSSDGARTWTGASRGLAAAAVWGLAVNPRVAGVVYASTRGAGVFRSTDAAASWVSVSSGLGGGVFNCVALDPTSPQILYAGADNAADQIFSSRDGGASWVAASPGASWSTWLAPRAIAVDPTNPLVVYAAGWMGLYKTMSAGSSWAPSATGMDLDRIYVSAFAMDPTNPRILYAGTGDGGTGGTIPRGALYLSVDGGASWRTVDLPDGGVNALVVDPSDGRILYAGLGDSRGRARGVYRSADGAASWSSIGPDLTVRSLALGPDRALYAGTQGGGVYRVASGGISWGQMNAGLTSTDVRALAFDPVNRKTIYAGTNGGGVFALTMAPVIEVGPSPLIADSTLVGSSSTAVLEVVNTGTADLSFGGVGLSGADATQFRIATASGRLAPGGTQLLAVTFAPTSPGTKRATLTLPHNAAGSPAVVPLEGVGSLWEATVAPASLDFGEVALGQRVTRAISVGHAGMNPLIVSAVTTGDAQFTATPTSFSVAAGAPAQVVTIAFEPTAAGPQQTTLSVVHNAGSSPSTVAVQGVGATPPVASPDFDGSGVVDFSDLFLLVDRYGRRSDAPGFEPAFDLDGDGEIGSLDFILFALNFGRSAGETSVVPPSSPGPNAGAGVTASLVGGGEQQTAETVRLAIGVTGVIGLTAYTAEILYDSTDIGSLGAETTLSGTFSPGQTLDTLAPADGFNRRTEMVGVRLPPGTIDGDLDLATFTLAPRPGLTAGRLGVRRLVVVADNRVDTLIPSPSPLILELSVPATPVLVLLPASVTFDTTVVGSASQDSFGIANLGSDSLSIVGVTVGGVDASQFSVSPITATLGVGDYLTATVTFAPSAPGVRAAVAIVQHDGVAATDSVRLSGVGVEPPPAGPIALDFNLASGDQGQRLAGYATPGRSYGLELTAAGLPEINGWSATVIYDETQLRLAQESFEVSDFIPGLVPLVNSRPGLLEVGGAVLGTGGGASGSAALGTVRFEVLDGFTGQTDLAVTEVRLRRLDGVEDVRQVWSPATITADSVAGGVAGDFDGDAEVGFSDFFLFADAFGSADARYDLDGDGLVGFGDFFLFADAFGTQARSKLMTLAQQRLGLGEQEGLEGNHPNPFNAETVISYRILRAAPVRLTVFDVVGQPVRRLVDGVQAPGLYRVRWDGTDDRGSPVGSGIYLCQARIGGSVQSRRMTVLR